MFAACAVPVHTWTTLLYFNQMPGWLVYLSTWDLIGTFAYVQMLALIESLTILLIMVLLAAILPARLFRKQFVAQGSVLAFLHLGWAIVIHLTGIKPWLSGNPWQSKKFLVGITAYLALVIVSYVLVVRYKRVQELVASFAERLLVLLYVYLPMGLFGIAIVIARNVCRSL